MLRSGPVVSPAVALSVSVRVSAGSDSAARLSIPVPVGVVRPPARALASIDGEASTGSGHRPPGSNRPVRMDRNTALTSTPSPSVGASMPWRECSPRGRSDWPSEAALILGSDLARSRSRRSSVMTASSPWPWMNCMA